MKKRISIVIVLLVLVVLMVSACNRPASKPPVPTPTLNLPVTEQQAVIEAEDLSTAATEEAGEEGVGGEEVVEVIEATPEPTATVEPTAEIPEITRPESYTLQSGEWPICIARRFDLDLGTFFALNGLSMDSRPAAGAVLKIPADGTWSVASYGERAYHAHPASYIVQGSDTIYTVACYFGDVSPEQIGAKNGIEAPYTLTAGQELQIP